VAGRYHRPHRDHGVDGHLRSSRRSRPTKEVLARYHKGSTITPTSAHGFSTIEIAAAQADSRAWGFDVVDGTNHIRIILERAEVTERGDIVYNNSDAIGYEMTVTAYPNDTGVVAVKLVDADGFASAVAGRAAEDLDLDRLIEQRRAETGETGR
jgi:hypothetical protein